MEICSKAWYSCTCRGCRRQPHAAFSVSPPPCPRYGLTISHLRPVSRTVLETRVTSYGSGWADWSAHTDRCLGATIGDMHCSEVHRSPMISAIHVVVTRASGVESLLFPPSPQCPVGRKYFSLPHSSTGLTLRSLGGLNAGPRQPILNDCV